MKLLTTISLLMLIQGCTSLPDMSNFSLYPGDGEVVVVEDDEIVNVDALDPQTAMQETEQQQDAIDEFGAIVRPAVYSSVNGAYKSRPLAKHVGDYVRNMAQDLVSNMEYVKERTPVAVTHFSLIDSDLKETNLLGYQIAESFTHEFHKFRMPVVEFKATQFIRVTDSGDFVLSRDFLDLKNATPIQYVLTGTMTKHQGGYLVNARMLGMQSNVVVASAQSFIPYYIADALLPSGSSKQNEIVDGVRLIQGD